MRKGKPPKNIRSSIAPSLRTRQNENQTDSDWDCPAPAPTLSCLHGLPNLQIHRTGKRASPVQTSGNCKFPHGHTRSVEMVFRAETLDANDMVLDFKAVKQMMGDFLQQFDHSLCVNTEDPNYARLRGRIRGAHHSFRPGRPHQRGDGTRHFQCCPARAGKSQGEPRRISRAGLC